MKPSLRRNLLATTALGAALVLGAAGLALHWLVRDWLWSEFDRSLTDKAAMLSAAIEEDRGRFEMEDELHNLPEFSGKGRPEYFEVRRPDGQGVLASPSLADRSLGVESAPLLLGSPPRIRALSLPDGRPGRAVSLAFSPKRNKKDRNRDAADDESLVLTLARQTETVDRVLSRLGVFLAGVGAAALAVCLAVLYLAVRRGLRPVRDLAGEIETLKEAGLSARVRLGGAPVELVPVVDRLNDLLAKLEASFAREKGFTADVAHELRTPLAGLRSALEVTAARPRTPDQYHQSLQDCLAIVGQMQSLVESLLSLARLEAGQTRLSPEDVDMADLLEECWRPLEPQASRRGLRVNRQVRCARPIRSDRATLALVLRNLLDNAVSYADEGGRVAIEAQTGDGEATVRISNSGSTVSAEEVGRVFDRFWRKDASRTETGRHSGLGLSVVREAVIALGGRVDAAAELGGTFTVTLRVPAAERR